MPQASCLSLLKTCQIAQKGLKTGENPTTGLRTRNLLAQKHERCVRVRECVCDAAVIGLEVVIDYDLVS